MTKFYGEFGVEIYDKSIYKFCFEVFNKFENLKIRETRRKTITMDICTPIRIISNLEEISDELYKIVNPYKNSINELLQNNRGKLFCSIFFVKVSKSCDCSLILNNKIINLASDLGIRIDFDGF